MEQRPDAIDPKHIEDVADWIRMILPRVDGLGDDDRALCARHLSFLSQLGATFQCQNNVDLFSRKWGYDIRYLLEVIVFANMLSSAHVAKARDLLNLRTVGCLSLT